MTLAARLCAVGIFTVAAVSLRMQFDVTQRAEGLTGSATLLLMLGSLTILTVVLVAVTMAAVAMRRPPGGVVLAAVAYAITMVGIVYHVQLAGLRPLQGAAFWADRGLHLGLPVLTVLWWIAFAPKGLRPAHLPLLMAWPVFYTLYALARGALTGLWPYPFLNADLLGWGGVARNLSFLFVGFAGIGVAQIALSHRLSR